MKNLVLSVMIIVFSLFACNQVKTPKEVTDAFNKQFASAENVQWDQEEENEWEAEFMMDGKEMTACFDNSGKWLETETEISIDNLPQAVTDSLKLKFEGFSIEEAENIEKPDFKGFEIVLEKEDEELEVLITASGEIISKNVIEEDEEDEEENGENNDIEDDEDEEEEDD